MLFQDFQANSYRKWIDGISKVATAAPDGSELKLVVLRNGKRVDDANPRAGKPLGCVCSFRSDRRRKLNHFRPTNRPTLGSRSTRLATTFSSTMLARFGNFFSGEASNASERAMAQLVRVGSKQPTAEPAVTQDVSQYGRSWHELDVETAISQGRCANWPCRIPQRSKRHAGDGGRRESGARKLRGGHRRSERYRATTGARRGADHQPRSHSRR